MNLKPLRNILKYTGFTLLAVIVLLLLFLFVGLKTNVVQKQLGKTASKFLSKKTETKVDIDKIAIHLFDRLALENAYFEDSSGDTLLNAQKLVVDINLKKVINKTIEIDKIKLEKPTINLIQTEDKKFNFQHIIDAFSSNNKSKKKQKKPFKFFIKKIDLTNADILLDLLSGKQDIQLAGLNVHLKSIDLSNLNIEANHIIIDSVRYIADFSKEKKTQKKKNNSNVFPLYNVPIKVTSDKLAIKNSFVDILTGENDYLGNTFNPQRIYANSLNIDFEAIYFDSTKASIKVNNISTNFGNYIDIQAFSGNLLFSANETSANNLEFKTGRSNAAVDASLKYDQFETFLKVADHLNVDISGQPINVHCAEIFYFIPKLSETLDCSQLPSNKLKLLTQISGNLAALNMKQFNASMGGVNMDLTGIIHHPTKTDKLHFENISLSANSPVSTIENIIGEDKLPIDLETFKLIKLNSNFSGHLNSIEFDQLKLSTNANTELDLNGTVQNLTDIKNLNYQLQIDHIDTKVEDLNHLLDALPDFLSNIETIHYEGFLKGSTTSFDLDGKLVTNLGEVRPGIEINFNQTYSDAIYKGALKIDDFQLGKLLNNDSIGNITLVAAVDGQGLSLDTINTKVDATINSFVFNGYEYKDLKIDGHLEQREFDGDIHIKDENIAFNFGGSIGINDYLPDFNFDLQLDTLNLQALNLSEEPIALSLNVTSDLYGGSIDDLKGELKLKDIELVKGHKVWNTDTLTAKISTLENGAKELAIQSEILNGNVTGHYTVSGIYNAVLKSVDTYFPVSEFLKIKASEEIEAAQNFEAELYLSDATTVSQLFLPSIKQLDTAAVLIRYNSEDDFFDIKTSIPEVELKSASLKKLELIGKTENNELVFDILSDSIAIGKGIFLPSAAIKTSFKDGVGKYEMQIKNDSSTNEFDLSGAINSADGQIEVFVDQSITLDGQEWNLGLKEPFRLGKGKFEYPSFDLIKEDEGVLLSKSNNGVIQLYFESFEVSHITNFLLNDSTSLDGSINGTLLIAPNADPMTIEGDLFVSTIQYNGVDLGNIGMIFENVGASFTTATIILSDLYTDVQIDAILSENQNIDAEVNINQFDLKAIEPFLRQYISDVEGGMEGYATIGGSLKAPQINGLIDINAVSAKINALGAYYAVEEGHIDIEKDNIITNIDFIDSLQRKAKFSGNITHNYFSDIGFNLNLNAESFTFLDTEKQRGLPFYGKLNAELDASITGTIQKPEIFAIFATDEDTDVIIEAASNNTSITNEPYVIFVDGSHYSQAEIDSIISVQYKLKTIFDLTVYANINDKAKLKVIIDPISGDYLTINGNGNMVVDVTESGELLVTGDYTVNSGEYRFTFQDFFLRKDFEIVPGGNITFVGPIMNANLDIEAAYKLKTSTRSLLEAEFETMSQEEQDAAEDPTTDVEVILGISGQLAEPAIEFDIRIPETTGNIVSNSASRVLEKLRSNKTDLNAQVFSLLLLQGFTTASKNSSNILYDTGAQIAFNSVSSFINNQLKKLTSKAKGLEVGVGLASTSGSVLGDATDDGQATSTLTSSTNIDLFIKQSLLNDRLVLQLGGNVDLDAGSSDGGLTGVAGDFILEYKLTKDGNLRMNVFQKSDYNLISDNNVWKTGAGLSYQKTFGKIGDDADRKKKKGKKRRKQQGQLEPSDAINKEQEIIPNDINEQE